MSYSRFFGSLLFLTAFCFSNTAMAEAFPPIYKHGNITVSNSPRFVWFRVAKVGTRTILDIFKANQVVFRNKAPTVNYNPLEYKRHFKFAFVRNPWDRVVSCYCNKVVNKRGPTYRSCHDKGFEYFVDFLAQKNLARADRHVRLQTKLFPYQDLDFIGRFENFEGDLKYVLKRLGIENVDIPKRNATHHEHYSKYYNERTRKIVEKLYHDDIVAFGYLFEEE